MEDRIFKYYKFNDHFIKGLKEKFLWFSNYDAFNDPFEFKLQTTEYLSDEQLSQYFLLMQTLDGGLIGMVTMAHIMEEETTVLYLMIHTFLLFLQIMVIV